jgi:hypothetical protein
VTSASSASHGFPVALWKPHVVGGVTLLFGFPGGIVLASLNWLRMGRPLKAFGHLAVGGLLAAIFFALSFALPPEAAAVLVPAFALLANAAILLYLLEATDSDVRRYMPRTDETRTASWLVGGLVGMLPIVVLVGASVVLAAA